MVGRTRLYQKTGSPLISGFSRRRPTRWWLIALVALIVLVAGVWAYLTYGPH